MSIKSFTKEQLETELKRRKEESKKVPPRTSITPQKFYDDMIRYCEWIFMDTIEKKFEDEDNMHYMYEEVLKLLYGPNIFKLMSSWTDD
jgi:GTP1/Obg family GTP-binding protein